MSNQVRLLPPESKSEALADLARHPAVGGWKNLAICMRPELQDDPEAAGKWLHRALDDTQRDVLHDEHLCRALRKGAQVGCHILWAWHAEDIGYEDSEPKNQKSRKLKLLEERERLAIRNRQIQEQLDQLQADV